MARLGRWCFEHRKRVVAVWLLAIVVIVGVSVAVGSSFTSSNGLPGTDSQAAATLLTQNFPAAAGEGDQVVIQAEHGTTIKSAPVQSAVTAALAKVAKVPGVESVASPYASNGAAQISRDGTIAFARVTWDKPATQVTTADAGRLIAAAESADGPDVHISLGGQSIETSERPSIGISVVVAVAAALVILLIVFGGALLSSLMPLVTAGLALVTATSLIGLLSHAFDVASVSSQLAILIGLGVGVDYGLFIISRHRSAVKDGLPYSDAAALAVRTSGRTVLLAGITVCIALLGQFALGVRFLYGPSLGAAIAVALTMTASLTFLPAMLGFLGPRVLSRRERARLAAGEAGSDAGGFWLRWARVIQARKALAAVGALAAVVVIALPVLSLRLGTSDASTDQAGSTTHQAYTALAQGFGPGFNGPLELVAQAGTPADAAAFGNLLTTAAHTPGVASVTPAQTSPNGKVLLATLYPTTSPQASQTIGLVDNLRDSLIPQAERGTGLEVHVGGETATNIDFSHVLTDKLPLFIAVVVILAFLLLMTVFRSLLIPLTASVMNLLSVGAALGALNAVFNWGWGSSILHLSGTGPIDAFIPVLLFSVLFGLSMDYEVYLVGRIQEEWHHLHHTAGDVQSGAPSGRAARNNHLEERDNLHQNAKDIQLAALSGRAVRRNHTAVTIGQAKSGEIIAAAASIMILVFGSFLLGGQRVLQEFGFGLGFAVLVDALVIRSILVPALMHLIGPANWALPGWLDRILPRVAVEAAEQPAATGPEADMDPAETR